MILCHWGPRKLAQQRRPPHCPWGLPRWHTSAGKCRRCNRHSSIPGQGRSPEVGNDNPLQSPRLRNPMDRGAWWATVHGVVAQTHTTVTQGHSPTQLSSPTDKSKRKGRKMWNANLVSSNEKMASLVAQTVKYPPAMRETWIRSPGREEPLEKEMANPLQYSCLKNSMDGETMGLQSRTWLSDFTFFLSKKTTTTKGCLFFFLNQRFLN